MVFTPFSIPKRLPDSRCQARIRLNGTEAYCDAATNGTRCPAHAARGLVQQRWAKVRQAQAVWQTSPKASEAAPTNNGSASDLDVRIRALNAVIAALEAKAPLTLEEIRLLSHLNKTLADLINAKLRLEQVPRASVDAEQLHQRALALFDRLIGDASLRAAVIEAFGQLLDALASHQNTTIESRREESPDVADIR